MFLENCAIDRVPSLKSMRSLMSLNLESNKITRIEPHDFVGATQLVSLTLANNQIVSVAAEAFANLAAFRFVPRLFRPTQRSVTNFSVANAIDGTPLHLAYGMGTYVCIVMKVVYAPCPSCQ